eukprot:TRINITY_DN2311_c0_g1_i1.p1 TRINITY_DN2311_c0_g1~~TRINITY_DN2311_c0_g1_i1.p1  ORF type:complete len:524 (+),score=138.87 TRINITY_DN2311_c0_g1_i1:34-1605(+)
MLLSHLLSRSPSLALPSVSASACVSQAAASSSSRRWATTQAEIENDSFDLDARLDEMKIEPATKSRVEIMSEKEKSVLQGLKDVGTGRTVKFEGVRDLKTRRWYSDVKVEEILENGMWTCTLDGRVVVSKTQKAMYLPNPEVASLIAMEWESQSEIEPISYATMPSILLAFKAHDDYEPFGKTYVDELMLVFDTDIVCMRERPTVRFHGVQADTYDPVMHWFESKEGLGLPLSKTVHMDNYQPDKTKDAVRLWLEDLEPFTFMMFHAMVVASKSFVATFGAWNGFLSFDELFKIARLDENYQASVHGEVEGSFDIKTLENQNNLGAALFMLRATEPCPTAEHFAELVPHARETLKQRRADELAEKNRKQLDFNQRMAADFDRKLQNPNISDMDRLAIEGLKDGAMRSTQSILNPTGELSPEEKRKREDMMEALAVAAAVDLKEKGMDVGDISREALYERFNKERYEKAGSDMEKMKALGFDVEPIPMKGDKDFSQDGSVPSKGGEDVSVSAAEAEKKKSAPEE